MTRKEQRAIGVGKDDVHRASRGLAGVLYALSHAIQNIVGERIEEERHDVSVWDIKISRVDVQGHDILAPKPGARIISNIPASISVKATRKFNSNGAPER